MHFFTVRDLRTSPKSVWDTLNKQKEVVITNNGKPSALMIPINDGNFDDVLATVRQVNAQRTISRMQRMSVKSGLDELSLNDINAEIAAARAENRV
ncbi:MAG: type II toxin-antitoxin system Phd/YefM family antitoxin [Oscillospiraceae bacterium]|jgi:antitoxin (DNA-binding transcriptional repressor) of toxin-antitoxin stability system|nr:type II toxin-antitoxin system Phd/YefM family antitoxin [Oscillospiraceae bacterium]